MSPTGGITGLKNLTGYNPLPDVNRHFVLHSFITKAKTPMEKKYVTVEISGIITSISKPTDIPGYTVGVIESFLPTDEELNKMSTQQEHDWTMENNTRMTAICKFLNDNNL